MALTTVGCESTPPLVLETEHFRVYADHPVCPERGVWLEHTYTALWRYLGRAEPPDGRLYSYVQYPTSEAAHAACAPGYRCASANAVHTDRGVDYHEIVHLVGADLGTPPRLMEEGLAEVLGGGLWAPEQRVDPDPAVRDWFLNGTFFTGAPEEYFARYGEAASFVDHLRVRFGPVGLTQLYAQLPQVPGIDLANRMFLDIVGVSFDEVFSDWMAAGPTTRDVSCFNVAECESPALTSELEEIQLSCGPDIGYPLDQIGAVRSFQSDGERATIIRLRSDDDRGWIRVRGCGVENGALDTFSDSLREAFEDVGVSFFGDRLLIAEIPEGQYAAQFRALPETPVLRAETSIQTAEFSATCGAAEPILVPDTTGEVSIFVSPERAQTWIQLRPETSVRGFYLTMTADEDGQPTVGEVTLCTDACDNCAIGATGVIELPSAATTVWLGVRPAGSEDAHLTLGWRH